MICVEDRRKMVAEVEAAHQAGARLAPACKLVGSGHAPSSVGRLKRAWNVEMVECMRYAPRLPMH